MAGAQVVEVYDARNMSGTPVGDFRLEAAVVPLAGLREIRLSWCGSEGVSFPPGTALEQQLQAPPGPIALELAGKWDGTLPGRVYLSVEWFDGDLRAARAVAVSVIDAASEVRLTRPAKPDGMRSFRVEPR